MERPRAVPAARGRPPPACAHRRRQGRRQSQGACSVLPPLASPEPHAHEADQSGTALVSPSQPRSNRILRPPFAFQSGTRLKTTCRAAGKVAAGDPAACELARAQSRRRRRAAVGRR